MNTPCPFRHLARFYKYAKFLTFFVPPQSIRSSPSAVEFPSQTVRSSPQVVLFSPTICHFCPLKKLLLQTDLV